MPKIETKMFKEGTKEPVEKETHANPREEMLKSSSS